MEWQSGGLGLVLAIASPSIGSFIGVAVERLHLRRRITWTRSECASCGNMLGARDLVPLVSYWVLKGRCRFCGGRIPSELFAVEAWALCVTVVTLAVALPERRVAGTLLVWGLLALSWFDYRSGRLPDALTIPLGASGFAITALTSATLSDHLLGAACGLVFPMIIAFSYSRWRGQKGLGGGDIKLLGAAGAWVGWQGLPMVLFLASTVSIAFCLARGRISATDSLPFGPFIAAATWMVWTLCPSGVGR